MKKVVVLLFLLPLISFAQRTEEENNQKNQNLDEVKFGFAESDNSPYSSIFEGLWYSDSTSFNTLITHNEEHGFMEIKSFSFIDTAIVREFIVSVEDKKLKTISTSGNNWKINITYEIINETEMKAILSGIISTTIIYKKLNIDNLN